MMNHSPKIGMIVNLFHPHVGGAERHAQQLASGLIEARLDVEVITRRQPPCPPFESIDNVPVYRILDYYDFFGLPLVGWIRPLNQRDTRHQVRRSSCRRARGKWVGRLLDEYSHLGIRLPLLRHGFLHRYDILHFHLLSTFWMLQAFPMRLRKIPKILKLGNIIDFDELRQRDMEHYFTETINHEFFRLVCISSEIRRRGLAIGIFGEKLINIPNGADTHHFAPPSPQAKVAVWKRLGVEEKFVILSIGSQQKMKGLDLLLQAVAILKSKIPNLHYLHVGRESNATAGLGDIVTRTELQGWVSFPGEVRDVIPYLQAADVFVLPSLGEGLSNALLEAMSTGLPVVATDVSGSQDLVRTGNTGMLVPAGDAFSLAKTLRMLFTNAELRNRCGQGARRAVQNGYSMDAVSKKYVELYNSVGEG